MSYEELFSEIEKPDNKVFKFVLSIKAGVENVKYLLRNEKGNLLFYVLGSDFEKFAPDWVIKKLVVNGQEGTFSAEQSIAIFNAISARYSAEQKKQEEILKQRLQKVKE